MRSPVVVLVLLVLLGACVRRSPDPAPVPSNEAAASAPAEEGVQYVGNPDADVRIEYWFDYQCPYCVAMSPTIDELARRYGDRIVIVYRNYPLSQHREARPAAIAAEAARRQGKFIEMYRALIASSPALSDADLRRAAQTIGLDMSRFDADVADPGAAGKVDRDVAEGEALGIPGVPYLRINGVEYAGGADVADISAAIDAQRTP